MRSLPRPRTLLTRLSVGLVSVATAAATMAALGNPAQAGVRVTPGNFTGYGFDQCVAPDTPTMNRWMEHSPFSAVGIYISGDSRGCRTQPNLSPAWVKHQLANGWRLLPITLGAQASCSNHFPRYGNDETINPSRHRNYFRARKQGRFEATRAVNTAKRLGIPARSTLWYDLEAFDVGNTRCRESALRFLHAWTNRVRGLGYRSGVYSSAASGIRMLDNARVNRRSKLSMPDQVWIADWDGKANLRSAFVRAGGWMPHARVKQYRGGHDETWGGKRINIDSNFLSTGRGSRFPKSKPHCNGRISIDRAVYPALGRRHATPIHVKVVQCMLKEKNLYGGPLNGKLTPRTFRAMHSFQRSRGIKVRNAWTRSAWAIIHTEGPVRTVKRGSTGPAVRRIQRALTASTGTRVPVTGVFNWRTQQVAKSLQRSYRMRRSGVVNTAVWNRLRNGRIG